MKKIILFLSLALCYISVFSQETGTFTDARDGKSYKTVKIGTQWWMAENLAYKPSSSNYWVYDNNSSNISKYGYLYDWETAKNVCPAGWHLPSDAEWTTLTNYLGGEKVAGNKMKATTGWEYDADGIGTNESGFNALPAGYRDYYDGSFGTLGGDILFWSSTPGESEGIWGRHLHYDNGYCYRDDYHRKNGFSVRCLKD